MSKEWVVYLLRHLYFRAFDRLWNVDFGILRIWLELNMLTAIVPFTSLLIKGQHTVY